MESLRRVIASTIEFEDDAPLMEQVLRPYKLNCRYLKAATVIPEGDPADGGRVIGRCEFSIPESCYIDDTGHFNSVEFNICYNQMMYYVVAKMVKERLSKAFGPWSMEDYWTRQLPDFLITAFQSAFKRPVSGRRFLGEIEFVRIGERPGREGKRPLLIMDTVCRYWDDNGGSCHGEVKMAITNAPQAR